MGSSGQFEFKRNERKKNEAVDILKLIDNDKEITKHGLKSSKSLESLDIKAPNEVCAHHIHFFFSHETPKQINLQFKCFNRCGKIHMTSSSMLKSRNS